MKHITIYKLFPKLVNISLPFITYEHSEWFQRILVRGAKIEWGSEAAKIGHFPSQLKLASDFVTSGGLILDYSLEVDRISNFKRVLLTFKRCYIDQN